MYELPSIIEIGKATDVVLGVASLGSDLDCSMVLGDTEFEDNLEDDALL
jgi:hypothetical protein